MGIVARHKSVGDVAVLERLNGYGNSANQNNNPTVTANSDNSTSTRTNGPAATTPINNASYSFGFGLNRLLKSGGNCGDESYTGSEDGRQVRTAGVFRKRTKSNSSSSSSDSSSLSSCSSDDDVSKTEINRLLTKRVGSDLNYFGRLDLLKNRRQYKSLAATNNNKTSSKTTNVSAILRNDRRDRTAAAKREASKDDLPCSVGLHESMGDFAVVNDDICIHNYTGGNKQDLPPEGYYCNYCHHESDSKHQQTIQSALSSPTLIELKVCKEHSASKEQRRRRLTRRLVSSTATKRQVRLRNIAASDSGSRKAQQRERRRTHPAPVELSSGITTTGPAVAHKLEGDIDGDIDGASSATVLHCNGPKVQVSVVSGASQRQHPLGESAQVRGGAGAALENSQNCCIVSVAALRGDNCHAFAGALDNKSIARNDGFYDDDYEDHKTLLAAAKTDATATGYGSHCCACSYCNDGGSHSDHWLTDCAAEANRKGGSIKLDGGTREHCDDDIGHRNGNSNQDNGNKTALSEKSSHRNGEQVAVRNELASGAGEDRRHENGQADECEGEETTAALLGCHIIESASSRQQKRRDQSVVGSCSTPTRDTKRLVNEEEEEVEKLRAESPGSRPGNPYQRANVPSGSASDIESVGGDRPKISGGNCVATRSRSMPSEVMVMRHNSAGNEKQSSANANLSGTDQQQMSTASVMINIHKSASPAANRSHLEPDDRTCSGNRNTKSSTSWRRHAKSFVPTTSSYGSYDVVQHERQYSNPMTRTEVDSGDNVDCITATATQQWRQISTPPEVFKSKGMAAVATTTTMQQQGGDTATNRVIASDTNKNNVRKNKQQQQWRLARPGRSPMSLARQTSARLARHRLNIQQQRQEQLAALARRERLNLTSAASIGSPAGDRTIASTNGPQVERSPQERRQATPSSSSSHRQSRPPSSDFIDVIDITSISDEAARSRRRSSERSNNNNNLRFYASAAATTASRPRARSEWHRLSYSTEEAPRRRFGIYLPSDSTTSSSVGSIWRQLLRAATFGYRGSSEEERARDRSRASRRATIDTVAEVCIDLQPQQVRPDVLMNGQRQQQVVSASCGQSNSSGTNMYRSIGNPGVPAGDQNNSISHRPCNNDDVSPSQKKQSPSKQSNKLLNNGDRREQQSKSSPSPAESTWSLEGKPFCKICHIGSSKLGDRLISPCKCSGTMRYIHCGCLLKWLELSTRTTDKPMSCELCSHEYTWHKRFNFKQLQLPKCSIRDMFLHFIFILSICSMLYFALAPMLSGSSSNSKLIAANSDTRPQIPTAAHLDSDSDFEHNSRFEGDASEDSIEKFVEQLIGKNKRRASQQHQKQQQINSNSVENTASQSMNKHQTALFTNQGSYHQNSNGRLASDEKFILISAAAFFISFFLGIYVQTKTRDTLYGLCSRFIQMNRTYYIIEYDHEQHQQQQQQQQQQNTSSGNASGSDGYSGLTACGSVAPPDTGDGYATLVSSDVVPLEQNTPHDTNHSNDQANTWNDNDFNGSTRSVSGRMNQINAASSSVKHCPR